MHVCICVYIYIYNIEREGIHLSISSQGLVHQTSTVIALIARRSGCFSSLLLPRSFSSSRARRQVPGRPVNPPGWKLACR